MEISFGFKGPFSTNQLNLITKDILPAGVYLAPTIQEGGYLSLLISPPWVIRTIDGMTIREEQTPIAVDFSSVGSGQYYVGVAAQYVVGGKAQVAVQQVAVQTYNDTWTTTQKSHFVILCEVWNSGSSLTVSQATQQTQPRGTFALQVDLLDSQTKSSISRVADRAALQTLLDGPLGDIPTNRVYYLEDPHQLAVFNGTGFDIVNPTFSGSGVFYDAPLSGPNPGTPIALDSSMPSTDPNNYTVLVTPTSETGAHTGEIWVEKGVLGTNTNLGYFTVKCSGRPNTLGGGTATFDYLVIPRT